jgi:hypothetical protein
VPKQDESLLLFKHLRAVWDVEHDRDPPLAAARTFQAAFKLIQRKLLAARPDERLHVELGRGLALDLQAAGARFGPGRQPQASHPHAPPELPGLSQGWSQTCEQKENIAEAKSRRTGGTIGIDHPALRSFLGCKRMPHYNRYASIRAANRACRSPPSQAAFMSSAGIAVLMHRRFFAGPIVIHICTGPAHPLRSVVLRTIKGE